MTGDVWGWCDCADNSHPADDSNKRYMLLSRSCSCTLNYDTSGCSDEGNCGRAGQDRAEQGRAPKAAVDSIYTTPHLTKHIHVERGIMYAAIHAERCCVYNVGTACSSSTMTITSASSMQPCTCSMAWRMDTWPVMAATCSGVDPAGAITSEITSKSTVRTIIDAPASSSRRTDSRLPLTAAKCRAVSPFSALLSMYLNMTDPCLSMLRLIVVLMPLYMVS